MIANQIFSGTLITYVLGVFYPMASAMAYGQRPKFVRAEHSATAVNEKCGYGPTLPKVVEGFLKEKVVLQYIPNLGKTAVLQVLLIAAPPTITRQSFFSLFFL